MKVLGDRISILKKENLISVVILPTTDKTKLRILFLWLLAWTVCGLIVFANYFKVTDQNAKLFIMVYLSFWFYFEFNIVRSFIWKRSGKEKLWIQSGILYYQRELNKKGKILEFNLDLISPLQLIELKPTRFSDIINQSFWVKGGERLEFYSQTKNVQLGMQITDEEAVTIMNEINRFIP
ncbi:hypothetical protein [Aurantibacillus circumpalustris]|uniref:hypothetical protein n=1 Tax=Aurantibacillus circumpalustris TaxID=3036359 RepID=UPI00295B33ED|nr:hypothetical protein [Aurantibacillus circumpalustris]